MSKEIKRSRKEGDVEVRIDLAAAGVGGSEGPPVAIVPWEAESSSSGAAWRVGGQRTSVAVQEQNGEESREALGGSRCKAWPAAGTGPHSLLAPGASHKREAECIR